jgi:SAM-dependent methyltransferase
LGVDVVACSSLALPFADASFDLVLDRHEALNPAEVGRVLRGGGTVLTQQVWHLWDELNEFFPRRTDFGDHFHVYQTGFSAAGLEIVDAREHLGNVAFAGLGDLVYMLCIAPWEIPEFAPLGDDLEALLKLEVAATTENGLVLTAGNYLVEAHKPASPSAADAPRTQRT